MRIELSRDNLLSQLPDGDLPDTLILEGKEVDLRVDPLEAKYALEYDNFTRAQWQIFKRLLESPAHFRQLAVYLNPRKLNHANAVARHMVDMRRILQDCKSSFTIEQKRGFGTYKLVASGIVPI